jgi:uncharacterized phage-associated protein
MRFEFKKAAQCLNYFARLHKRHELSKLNALKLVFLADRYHLRKYGRLITNDEYYAMRYGPVPSFAKDLIDSVVILSREEKDYLSRFIAPCLDRQHHYQSIANVDQDELSETDMEALRFVGDNFCRPEKHVDLVKLTHLFPEWKKHEAKLSGGCTRVKMSVEDFLDVTGIPEEYAPLDDAGSAGLKECLKEQNEIAGALLKTKKTPEKRFQACFLRVII